MERGRDFERSHQIGQGKCKDVSSIRVVSRVCTDLLYTLLDSKVFENTADSPAHLFDAACFYRTNMIFSS